MHFYYFYYYHRKIDSPEGQQAMARVNHIHKMLAKHGRNQDFIYVLCCFVVDTIRLIDLVGWRVLTQHENEGTGETTAVFVRRKLSSN